VLAIVFFLDLRYRVLPTSIHNHLPAHHEGLLITDITVKKCSALNPLSGCRMNPEEWDRIDKDLYLNTGWVSGAYVHVKRRREEDLTPDDHVVMDVKISRLNPGGTDYGTQTERWESRPGGIWLKRSTKRSSPDSHQAVTAIDVLFGADAADPRPGWKVKDTPILLEGPADDLMPRLSVRQGPSPKVEKPTLRVKSQGRFKIMQASDLHLSTGLGHCRDAEPKDGSKCDADPRTLEFVTRMLDAEKPDLIVLSGDQVNGDTSPDAQTVSVPMNRSITILSNDSQAIFKFAELFIERKIPYVCIFGNHDDEGNLSREEMMSVIETLPYSLSEAGPPEIDGVGNYLVEVLAPGSSHHSALSIYLLDTHGYSPDENQFRGYDWLKPNQIEWFRQKAESVKEQHHRYTHIHMNMAFIHIPLPEYRDYTEDLVGSLTEGITAPGFNSHFKDALVEQNVLAVSCGQ
jgi:hypothetical protein